MPRLTDTAGDEVLVNTDGSINAVAVQGIADSVVGSGVATAPLAGATIATIAAGSLPAGKYEIRTYAGVSNVAVADLANFELQVGGVDFASPLPQGGNASVQEATFRRVTLSGSQALDIKAIGAATAAIEYVATIVATRVS